MKPKRARKHVPFFERLKQIVTILWQELKRKKDWFDKVEEENGL